MRWESLFAVTALVAALTSGQAYAQEIIAHERADPPPPLSAPEQTQPSSWRPGVLFLQPLQPATYAAISVANSSAPRFAVPLGLLFEDDERSDFAFELTEVNSRGRGELQSTSPVFGARAGNGNFSRTFLYASAGLQSYSGRHRTGLFVTPKVYGALFSEAQTSPSNDAVGGQFGVGLDLGLSLQWGHAWIALVGGFSVGIVGGVLHEPIISPMVGLGGRSTDPGLVFDLNLNLLRVGFAF